MQTNEYLVTDNSAEILVPDSPIAFPRSVVLSISFYASNKIYSQ